MPDAMPARSLETEPVVVLVTSVVLKSKAKADPGDQEPGSIVSQL